MRLHTALFFLLCSIGPATVFSGELWDQCVKKIAADVPRRGTNTKADQQNYFREHGTLPQFSETFRIDSHIKAPKTLFLASEETYIILKGVLNRSGIKADLVPYHYFTHKNMPSSGKKFLTFLQNGGYGCIVSMVNPSAPALKWDPQSKTQIQTMQQNGLKWLEIDPSTKNGNCTVFFPGNEWKNPRFETADGSKYYAKPIGKGTFGVLRRPLTHDEADYFAVFQAYQHILMQDGKLALAWKDNQVSYCNNGSPFTAEYEAEFFDEVRSVRYKKSGKVKIGKKGTFTPAYPAKMPFGEYQVKIRLWNVDKSASVSGAGRFSSLSSGALKSVELPEKFTRSTPCISGKIQFKKSHAGGKLKIRLLNQEQKYLPFSFEQKNIKSNIAACAFTIPVDYDFLNGNFGYVEAEFTPGSGCSTVMRQLFFAPHAIRDQHDDYLQILWGMPYIRNEWRAFVRMAQKYGFNSISDGHYHNPKTYKGKMVELGRSGLPVFLEYLIDDTTIGHWGYRNKNHLYRVDLGNRKFRRNTAAASRQRAKDLVPFGIAGYACGEEIGMGTDELCFHPATQYLFGKWSLKKYGSLENLDRVWGTAYKESDEIRGILHRDLLKRDPERPAQWLDFRMFMEEMYNSLIEKEFFNVFKKADPEVAAGYNAGPYTDVPTQALNAARLGKTINFAMEYQPGFLGLSMEFSGFDMLSARNIPYLYVVGGYPNHYQKTDANYDFRNWYAVLHGARGFAWYRTLDDSRYSKFSGRYMPRGEIVLISRISNELRHGFGKLLMNATPRIRAGIYYSRLSRYMISHLDMRYDADPAARAKMEAANAEAARKDPGILGVQSHRKAGGLKCLFRAVPYMKALMEHSGERWKLVFEDQLLNGEVEKQYKILCLPGAIVLSEPEIKALRRFVENGGILIADTMTGWYDEYGNPNPLRSEVDALFGVTRKYNILPDFSCQTILLNGKRKAPVYRGETLAPERGASGDGNLMIVRKTGKGATLYLGGYFTERVFNGLNIPLIPEEVRCRVTNLLDAGDIKLMAGDRVIPGITGVEMSDYRSGAARMLIFQRRFGVKPEPVSALKFGRIYHIYDSRAKKYLGYHNAIPFRMPDTGRTVIYSLLPYKVDSLVLQADRKSYTPGEKGKITVSLRGTGKNIGAGHVIALRVFRPDGSEEYRMEKNLLLQDQSGILYLPFLPDDPAGTWKIQAEDIISGCSQNLTVQLTNRRK